VRSSRLASVQGDRLLHGPRPRGRYIAVPTINLDRNGYIDALQRRHTAAMEDVTALVRAISNSSRPFGWARETFLNPPCPRPFTPRWVVDPEPDFEGMLSFRRERYSRRRPYSDRPNPIGRR